MFQCLEPVSRQKETRETGQRAVLPSRTSQGSCVHHRNERSRQVVRLHIMHTVFLEPEAPQGGWRSSLPACTASLIFGSSKAPYLGGGQGHISMRNNYRTISVSNHLTAASRITEIWPFECREISTFGEVWTLVIAFLEGDSEIRLRHAVVQIPCYHQQLSVLSSTPKPAEEIDLEKWNFRNFGCSVPLTLTLDRLEVTPVHIPGRGLPTH